MKFNKDLMKTISIIILIILLVGVFLVPLYNQTIYEKGFVEGQINIAQNQMQTGNVYIINNGTIEGYPISNFCNNIQDKNNES